MLVLSGADIDAENKDGLSPLQIPSEAVEDIFEGKGDHFLRCYHRVLTEYHSCCGEPESLSKSANFSPSY
jgi:hypothetical protein